MKVADFTKPEIDYFLDNCNFSLEEETLFRMRCRNVPLEQCAEEMNISVSTVKRLSRKMKNKIVRVC